MFTAIQESIRMEQLMLCSEFGCDYVTPETDAKYIRPKCSRCGNSNFNVKIDMPRGSLSVAQSNTEQNRINSLAVATDDLKTIVIDNHVHAFIPWHFRSKTRKYERGTAEYFGMLLALPRVREYVGLSELDCLVGLKVLHANHNEFSSNQLSLDQARVVEYLKNCALFNRNPVYGQTVEFGHSDLSIVSIYERHCPFNLDAIVQQVIDCEVAACMGALPMSSTTWRKDWRSCCNSDLELAGAHYELDLLLKERGYRVNTNNLHAEILEAIKSERV